MDIATAVVTGLAAAVPIFLLGFRELAIRLQKRRLRERSQERAISMLASREVAERVGAAPAADLLPTTGEAAITLQQLAPDARLLAEREISRRVDESVQRLQERMKDLEARFPTSSEFQKFADANQLFLAMQVGDLTKRLDKLDERMLTRTQVAGIVLATLVTFIGIVAGIAGILRTFGLMH
jgi:hypothetical protein